MADKKYKNEFAFSTYVDKRGIKNALYGDVVGDVIRTVNQSLTDYHNAIDSRKKARDSMEFQAEQNKLDRDFKKEEYARNINFNKEQNKLDWDFRIAENQKNRDFQLDMQDKEFEYQKELLDKKFDNNFKLMVQQADIDNAVRMKGIAFDQWGNIVNQWIGDPESNTGIFEDLKGTSDVDSLIENLDAKARNGFQQAKEVGFKDQNEYSEWYEQFKMQLPAIKGALTLVKNQKLKQESMGAFESKADEYISGYDENLTELGNNHMFFLNLIEDGKKNNIPADKIASVLISKGNERFLQRANELASISANDPKMTPELFGEELSSLYNLFLEDAFAIADENLDYVMTGEQKSNIVTIQNNIPKIAEDIFSKAQENLEANATQAINRSKVNVTNAIKDSPNLPISLLQEEVNLKLKDFDGNKSPDYNMFTDYYFQTEVKPLIMTHNATLELQSLLGEHGDVLKIDNMSSFMYDILGTDSGLLANEQTTISFDGLSEYTGDVSEDTSIIEQSISESTKKLNGDYSPLGYGINPDGSYSGVVTNSENLAYEYLKRNGIEDINPVLLAVTATYFDSLKEQNSEIYKYTLEGIIMDTNASSASRDNALNDYMSLPNVTPEEAEKMKTSIIKKSPRVTDFMENQGGQKLIDAWVTNMHFQNPEFEIKASQKMKWEIEKALTDAENMARKNNKEWTNDDMMDVVEATIETKSANIAQVNFENNDYDFFSQLSNMLEGRSTGIPVRSTQIEDVYHKAINREIIGFDYNLFGRVEDAMRTGGEKSAIDVLNKAFGLHLTSYKDTKKLADPKTKSSEIEELVGSKMSRAELDNLLDDIYMYYGIALYSATSLKMIDDNFTGDNIQPIRVQTPYGNGYYYPDNTIKVCISTAGQGKYMAYHVNNDDIIKRIETSHGKYAPSLSRVDLAGKNCDMKMIGSPSAFNEGEHNYQFVEQVAEESFGKDNIPRNESGVDWEQLGINIDSGKYPEYQVEEYNKKRKNLENITLDNRYEAMQWNKDYIIFNQMIKNAKGMEALN